jgi:hypothetical protein
MDSSAGACRPRGTPSSIRDTLTKETGGVADLRNPGTGAPDGKVASTSALQGPARTARKKDSSAGIMIITADSHPLPLEWQMTERANRIPPALKHSDCVLTVIWMWLAL